MSIYRVYTDVACPRCGCTEARDDGPYEYMPLDDALGGPPDPRVHLMWCLGCGKSFDVAPEGAIAEIQRARAGWNKAHGMDEQGRPA
jgi:hypothetical protein